VSAVVTIVHQPQSATRASGAIHQRRLVGRLRMEGL
jgi:hypothetical protein